MSDGEERYWLSWWEPSDDYRPINYPPSVAILGWWCSGYDENDKASLCAVVDADSEEAAWDAVDGDWPSCGCRSIRFMKLVEKDWLPGDRFPLSDWMFERFGISQTDYAERMKEFADDQ